MTTVREYLELGIINQQIIQYWKTNKGNIPLCCFSRDQNGNYTCTYLQKYHPPETFKHLCRKCQSEISKILEKSLEAKRK
jgi:hypothetical protein